MSDSHSCFVCKKSGGQRGMFNLRINTASGVSPEAMLRELATGRVLCSGCAALADATGDEKLKTFSLSQTLYVVAQRQADRDERLAKLLLVAKSGGIMRDPAAEREAKARRQGDELAKRKARQERDNVNLNKVAESALPRAETAAG